VDASGFFLYDNGTGLYVAASRSVSPDGHTLSLAPDAPLLPGHYYRLYAYPPIRDLAGNPLYYYVYFFVSYGGPDTTPPQVVSVSPADGLTAVPINAPVSIDFDEPLQSLGLAGVELKVGGAAVAVVRSLSAGNQKLTLRPILPLTEATTYDVTIAGVKDVAGNILSGSVGSSFTSGNSVDLVPLSITSVSPPQGASGVPTNSVVVIQFSERANPQTVSSSNFRLWTGGCYGTPVLGTLEIAPDSLSATLTPAGSLPGLTGFCVTVSGIADLVGQTSSFSSSFTTGP
jgi:hypothetical protein